MRIRQITHRSNVDEFIITRTPEGVRVNIDQTVVHHSPTGFEFGYGGSGPADLALNILEHALESVHYMGKRMDTFRSRCFGLAWDLHHDFKWEYIATLPHEGGVIPLDEVIGWLEAKTGCALRR